MLIKLLQYLRLLILLDLLYCEILSHSFQVVLKLHEISLQNTRIHLMFDSMDSKKDIKFIYI
jgi:hypothetical protein